MITGLLLLEPAPCLDPRLWVKMEWNSGENGETIFIFTFVLLDDENGKSENENKGRISVTRKTSHTMAYQELSEPLEPQSVPKALQVSNA
jgi:hypothetical protein